MTKQDFIERATIAIFAASVPDRSDLKNISLLKGSMSDAYLAAHALYEETEMNKGRKPI